MMKTILTVFLLRHGVYCTCCVALTVFCIKFVHSSSFAQNFGDLIYRAKICKEHNFTNLFFYLDLTHVVILCINSVLFLAVSCLLNVLVLYFVVLLFVNLSY